MRYNLIRNKEHLFTEWELPKQVLANGKNRGLYVRAVLVLPEGFELAPMDCKENVEIAIYLL